MLETELIEAAVAGDIDSFGSLAERHYPALVAIGYSVLADHAMAEDAAQEALARAPANLPGLRNKTRFGPWLARIGRNVATMCRQQHPMRKGFSEINSEKIKEFL